MKAKSDTVLLIAGSSAFAVLLGITALLAPGLVERFYPLPIDQGAAWYYWQLANPTTVTRLTYWCSYGVHQILIWVTLGLAMKRSLDGRNYQSNGGVSRFNVIAMSLNVGFVALHLVQTYFWYDGLAQDVPIWTSQGSVIVMLVLILVMEIPHRGLVWGIKMRTPAGLQRVLRIWHGPYIAWAVTYTFWFHPMEGNWGLLSGFLYMFLLFIQLGMFNTRVHMNRAWVVLLEVFVAVHGTLITIYKHNPIWPMFMIGFLVMFVLTQMHELGWARKLRWPILSVFVIGVVALYVFIRGIEIIYEIAFIPVALYGGALALIAVGRLAERIVVVRNRTKT